MVPPPEPSVFRGTLEFFGQIGVYDVVLPFLLIFTLIFAILEKTKIYGTEKIEGKELTRKNLNAMTAFVIAFFVVASTQLVAIINEVLAHTVLLLLLSICFLMLVGSFHTGKEEFALKKGWRTAFMWIMFIGIVMVFLNALGWLQVIYNYVVFGFSTVVVSSIIFVVIIIVAIAYVTGGFDKKKKSEEETES
ncbi:hypothetical protein AYK26_01690 [Euryarchaeota archaeon SM23-78]|nr:MAG: hypothetical protein AYK26_01690 [Euryarchaeota archaeon SM23-78]MBW3000491.1 hypothetical protein [Candidatus Woesearchaeota archaeon]